MSDINLDKLRDSLFQLTRDLVAGKEIKKASIRVTVEIPEVLFDAICDFGDQMGVDASEAFQKLANEGIMERMKSLIAGVQPQTPKEDVGFDEAAASLKSLGIDVEGLMAPLEQLKGMIPQLQGFEEVFKNAGFATQAEVPGDSGTGNKQRDNAKDKKDSE